LYFCVEYNTVAVMCKDTMRYQVSRSRCHITTQLLWLIFKAPLTESLKEKRQKVGKKNEAFKIKLPCSKQSGLQN